MKNKAPESIVKIESRPKTHTPRDAQDEAELGSYSGSEMSPQLIGMT